jgi:hypothetical protein
MSRLSPVLCWFRKREFEKLFSPYRHHFPCVKTPGFKDVHKSNAEIKNEWSYKSTHLFLCQADKYLLQTTVCCQH